MANLAGFGTAAVGHMINHYTRHHDDPDQTKYTYKNQNIDPSRTHLNYVVGEARPNPEAFVREMIARSDVPPRGGARATNVISDWVVTIPKNEALEGREKEFFEQAYDFLKEKVGEDRIIGAYVHMDEGMPHMHFAFVPLVATPVMTNDKSRPLIDKNGNIKHDTKGTIRYERVPKLDEDGNPIMRTSLAQSKMFGKQEMREFHPDLEEKMQEHFGFKVGIQLDEKQVVEKALSKVPQETMDDTRKALEKELVAPAQAQADRLVQVAKVDAQGWQEAAEQAKDECRQEIRKAEATAAQAAQAQQAAQAAKAVEMQAKQATEMAKGELVQTQQATEVAKGELGQIQQQAEQTQDRLECLRRDEAGERAAIAELDRAIDGKQQELAAAPTISGDDRQAAGQEQQEHERASDEQGHSIGEQVRSLGHEAAEAIQRASSREAADTRGLAELGEARAAAAERVAGLEQHRDATTARIAQLEGTKERREQECRAAESQEQKAGERLRSAEGRIGELRERLADRVSQLRERLGLDRAREAWQAVKAAVGLAKADMGDAAHRVSVALRPEPPSLEDKQQEYSARDYARYAEQDRGMER